MQHYSSVVQDKYGNVQSGVLVTVLINGVAASIYASNSTSDSKANPITTNSFGEFDFYAPDGAYTASAVVNGATYTEDITLIDSTSQLLAWAYVQAFDLVSATRNSNGAVTSASIVWPDGASGTFTADTLSTSFPGAIDAWHATHVVGSQTKTVTQTAVTRDSNGAVTAQPAITVS